MEDDKRSIAASAKRTALLHLGNRLRRARERSRMTQVHAAEKLEVTPQTVRNWETGRNEPPKSVVENMAELYGLPLEKLLEDIDAAILPARPRPGSRYNRVAVDPEKISEARRSARLTQARVSELTGLSLSTISRYEIGGANPATRTLEVLTSIYDRPAEWFTPRGYFTDDERKRFAESIDPWLSGGPTGDSKDDIVTENYHRARENLSEESKLKIVNFIIFIENLERSGDDFHRAFNFGKRRFAQH